MLTEPTYNRAEVSDLEYFQTYGEPQTDISNRTIALILIGLVVGNIAAISFLWFWAKIFFNL